MDNTRLGYDKGGCIGANASEQSCFFGSLGGTLGCNRNRHVPRTAFLHSPPQGAPCARSAACPSSSNQESPDTVCTTSSPKFVIGTHSRKRRWFVADTMTSPTIPHFPVNSTPRNLERCFSDDHGFPNLRYLPVPLWLSGLGADVKSLTNH